MAGNIRKGAIEVTETCRPKIRVWWCKSADLVESGEVTMETRLPTGRTHSGGSKKAGGRGVCREDGASY